MIERTPLCITQKYAHGAKASHAVRRSRRRQAGMMLATMMAMMLVLAIILFSVVYLTSNLLQSTNRRVNKTEAVNVADSGIDLGVAWLSAQAYPPDDAALHPLAGFFGATMDAQGRAVFNVPFGDANSTLTVAIYADNANASATQKRYLIEAKAVVGNGVTSIVRGYAQQVSFGKYAFFADIDSGGFWDWHNHFEGPFHSNCSDGKPSTFLWTPNLPTGTPPMFQYEGGGALETTMTPTWWKESIGNTSAPASASDWNKVAAGGLASISINPNNNIALPTTDYQQEYVALGQTAPTNPTSGPSSGVPTRTGVTVSQGGGIFIHGDSQSVTLSVDGSNNQVFTVVTNPSGGYTLTQTVTVTANYTTTTSVLKNGAGVVIPSTTSPANQYPNNTVAGPSNGVVFSDGNINSISGTIADNTVDSNGNIIRRNEWSIATDTGAGKDMNITDSIKYKTQRDFTKAQSQDTNYNTNAGTLGLIARNVNLSKLAPAKVDVNAVIFCTGTYKAENAGLKLGTSATMTEVGGVIVKESGIFAYADNSGNLVSGWNESYHYDTRMADHPPPYFPTTGNHYQIISYQAVQSTLQ